MLEQGPVRHQPPPKGKEPHRGLGDDKLDALLADALWRELATESSRLTEPLPKQEAAYRSALHKRCPEPES